jgi:hypothetical protein
MSASCSSAPEASKIPPDDGELLGEVGEALLEGDDEHGGPFPVGGARSAATAG